MSESLSPDYFFARSETDEDGEADYNLYRARQTQAAGPNLAAPPEET